MSNPGKKSFEPVRSDVSLPGEEEKILGFWEQNRTFEKSVSARKDAKAYSFYDGPPFATVRSLVREPWDGSLAMRTRVG